MQNVKNKPKNQAKQTLKKGTVIGKTTKIVVSTKGAIKVKKAKYTDPQAGYKKNPYLGFPVSKSSKTEMVRLINNSNGCPFISTHVGKDGALHTLSAVKRNSLEQTDEFGYIKVYSIKDKAPRLINPQTLVAVRIRNVVYAK